MVMRREFRSVDNTSRVVEITSRTNQGRFLLRPSKKVNDLILGVLGRAQAKYDVDIYAFVFMSNHFHLLMKADTVEQMSLFVGYLKANIAIELRRVQGWDGAFWGRRFTHSGVGTTELDQRERLVYILENGCKEDLVGSPVDWPGVASAKTLVDGESQMFGTWFDRSAEDLERRCGRKRLFPSDETVRLSPLPFLASQAPVARRAVIRELVRDVETRTAERHRREGSRPIGAKAVECRDPHDRATKPPSTPAPRFLASDPQEREHMRAARLRKQIAYREAAEKLKSGDNDYQFPEDCFPPGLPFIPPRAPS